MQCTFLTLRVVSILLRVHTLSLNCRITNFIEYYYITTWSNASIKLHWALMRNTNAVMHKVHAHMLTWSMIHAAEKSNWWDALTMNALVSQWLSTKTLLVEVSPKVSFFAACFVNMCSSNSTAHTSFISCRYIALPTAHRPTNRCPNSLVGHSDWPHWVVVAEENAPWTGKTSSCCIADGEQGDSLLIL